ncbi:putative diphthamide synthesis protein-domain-containing protein [Gorgonomyces haynaldii]|nr:putative diphthamide synthesis protein-domain-containing protein [Gorgonomyces haynaldii]
MDLSDERRLIAETGAKKVCLQFPDHMLQSAPAIAEQLRDSSRIYVLGDTTFGSCCVDTVAAQHVDCDLLIHYGPTCLSKPSCAYPVLFKFDKLELDLEDLFSKMQSLPSKTLVMYDTGYYHLVDTIQKQFPDLIWSEIDQIHGLNEKDRQGYKHCHGRYYQLEDMNDLTVFYFGPSSLTLTHVLMSFPQSNVLHYDPESHSLANPTVGNRLLMRRYALVQKAKDAHVIGIVCGTLGVASYLGVVNVLKRLILSTGRKPYLVAVGKPNPAKLGNFLEVDCFCLVSCPENALLDSKEFMTPIVTPYELLQALDVESVWNPTDYELDLRLLETRLKERLDAMEQRPPEEDAQFSLATGKIQARAQHAKKIDDMEDSSLVLKASGIVSGYVVESAGAQFLAQRSFQGLQIDDQEASTLEEGRDGIARGYGAEKDL